MQGDVVVFTTETFVLVWRYIEDRLLCFPDMVTIEYILDTGKLVFHCNIGENEQIIYTRDVYTEEWRTVARRDSKARTYARDGLVIICDDDGTEIMNVNKVNCIVPLLVGDVLPSDILYDVFKLF
jgi:hypothetical protein